MANQKPQQNYEYRSHNLEETEQLAAFLAQRAMPGTMITLDGDLGAGKTHFSKAFARHLGVPGMVNSPTFTIIKEYQGRMPFYHMDVYRISEAEAADLGLDEYFFGEGATLVEWSSRIEDLLPEDRLALQITVNEDDSRTIACTGYGEPYAGWCRELIQNGVSDN
ncbi:tRNA (adenosine(37)-N6)-threonylcarbamoyltransferase complex ATPase subunit type 1 TsaE [Paenibacillus wulumuqiensis]|uniref:tRNA (adenosine(37)-N6)-threonylcarbamoyltransferase complex ATPase subunit type 1 TsaE n=1 Tax=Paenibacillus wulumuqiensis TaxID=1567107 RepID=UPI000619A9A2|nr:tRNA (adenosine(37)-N6)-threonylcarbamoyltransferase complex ATPase subunit type 1 TsaE [Paenibacillus wulumuqiensis]